jgi:hypothetical protein
MVSIKGNLLVFHHRQVPDIGFNHHGHGAADQVFGLRHDQFVGHGFFQGHFPKQAMTPGHVAPQHIPLGKNSHRRSPSMTINADVRRSVIWTMASSTVRWAGIVWTTRRFFLITS